MKMALIYTAKNEVKNIILVDPGNLPDAPEGMVLEELNGRNIGDVLTDGEWIKPTPKPIPYAPSDLSQRRFEYLLAYTGLDDVWDALEAELKATDRAMFAQIKAQRSALSFSQEKTLGLVAMFADTAKRVAPDADLSDDAIKAAWIVAEQATL